MKKSHVCLLANSVAYEAEPGEHVGDLIIAILNAMRVNNACDFVTLQHNDDHYTIKRWSVEKHS